MTREMGATITSGSWRNMLLERSRSRGEGELSNYGRNMWITGPEIELCDMNMHNVVEYERQDRRTTYM